MDACATQAVMEDVAVAVKAWMRTAATGEENVISVSAVSIALVNQTAVVPFHVGFIKTDEKSLVCSMVKAAVAVDGLALTTTLKGVCM